MESEVDTSTIPSGERVIPDISSGNSQDQFMQGQTSEEAGLRLGKYGPNVMPDSSQHPFHLAMSEFWAPVPWIREAAIVIQIFLEDYIGSAIVSFLLIFKAALGYFQKGKPQATLATLKSHLALTASVLHFWGLRPSKLLVLSSCGDILIISILATGGILIKLLVLSYVMVLLVAAILFAVMISLIKIPIFRKIQLE